MTHKAVSMWNLTIFTLEKRQSRKVSLFHP